MQFPTVKQLRYLVALAEHKHFGRAATACFVSQSAFSIGIQELEALLKVRLVDRTSKRVVVTRLGEEIATQARLCLRDLESLVEMSRGERAPLSGVLRMGVIPTIAPFLLPKIMPVLRKAFPQLELYLKEDVTQRSYEALLAGEIDVMLYAEPFDLYGVQTLELFRDRFLLAYREGTERVDPLRYTFNRLNAHSVLLLKTATACAITRSRRVASVILPRSGPSQRAACSRWCRWWTAIWALPFYRRWPSDRVCCAARALKPSRSRTRVTAPLHWPGAKAAHAARSSPSSASSFGKLRRSSNPKRFKKSIVTI